MPYIQHVRRVSQCRNARRRFPWRLVQRRHESVNAAAIFTYVAEEAFFPETRPPVPHASSTSRNPLEGVSIAYHLRRRRYLEASPGIPRAARIIGIRDPTTGYLYMDGPGLDDQQLMYARALYASTSVAERRRMLVQEMSFIEEKTRLLVSSRDYGHRDTEIKAKLRRQLLDCTSTKDIFRIAAAAFQHRQTAVRLSKLGENIVRAFFRSRSSTSDYSIAARMLALVRRFDQLEIEIQPVMLTSGLRFALRSRSLQMSKRYLRELRRRKIGLGSTLFRALIAKCSIGKQGFGEIRNGRWKRNELLQVLLGFEDDIPGHECHLKTFLNREDWQFTAAWTQILSRIGEHDELWKEWLIWKHSEGRHLDKPICQRIIHPGQPGTWRLRGDRWFVHMFIESDRSDRAWQVLKETGFDPLKLRRECLHQLLERSDLATVWNEKLRLELVEKLAEDMAAIEQMLGVKWVTQNGVGYHAPTDDAALALERLTEPEYFARYGFFTHEIDD